MKRQSLTTALCIGTATLWLGACAQYAEHRPRYAETAASRPEVLIVDRGAGSVPSIAVSPRTLDFSDRKKIDIVWKIAKVDDPKARQFRFVAGKGIEIRGEIKLKVVPIDTRAGAKSAYGAGTEDETFLDAAQKEIGPCYGSNDGLTFTCTNMNSRPGRYKYAIQVTDGKESFGVDPSIENW